MPKTKFQGIIFGLIMSYTMAYGMEVYNVAIKMGFNVLWGRKHPSSITYKIKNNK